MFQNINKEDVKDWQEENTVDSKKGKNIVKNMVTKQNIIIYVLSFMLSTVGFGGIAPFGIAILSSSCSNYIPIGIVYILTCIGTFVGMGKDALLGYFLTSLLFFIGMLLIRPKVEETKDRRKLGMHVFVASLLGQGSLLFFQPFLVYNLLETVFFAIVATIFYQIFSGSINTLRDFGIKKAFSIEEVMGASLMIAIAVSGFKDFAIFGYSIKNILSILIVLILGWQNGMLVGATSGVTIGVVLGIIGNSDPIQIAAYALSGLLAGLFNRLGKMGVIIGFIVGNGILSYVSTGNTQMVIMFQEILIASIGLLAVPKSVKIDIDDLFGKRKCLPVTIDNRLEQKEDTIYKLNTVSDAISEVAKNYQEVAATVLEEDEDILKNREIFAEELKNSLQNKEENLLQEDIMENEGIVEDIFDKLLEQEVLVEQDILDIFAKHNNFIIGFEDDVNFQIKEDVREILKAINSSYRISKFNFVWKRKIEENKKVMGNQLEDISKAISSIAKGLEEDKPKQELEIKEEEIRNLLRQKQIEIADLKIKKQKSGRFVANVYLDVCKENEVTECKADSIQKILSKSLKQKMVLQEAQCPIRTGKNLCNLNYLGQDNYVLQVGIARTTKNKSSVSGDSSIYVKLADGKYLLALADGMGSGPEARKSSKIAIKMLQRLLASGFDKDISIKLINSSIFSTAEETYATLDIAILDLYAGNMEMIKNGACPTYIKNKKQVEMVKTMSLPAGIIDNIDSAIYDKDLEENDMIVMCSDGILEANQEYKNKELWLKYLLEEMETTDAQKMADIILQEAIDKNYGIAKDDMTILVAKVRKEK